MSVSAKTCCSQHTQRKQSAWTFAALRTHLHALSFQFLPLSLCCLFVWIGSWCCHFLQCFWACLLYICGFNRKSAISFSRGTKHQALKAMHVLQSESLMEAFSLQTKGLVSFYWNHKFLNTTKQKCGSRIWAFISDLPLIFLDKGTKTGLGEFKGRVKFRSKVLCVASRKHCMNTNLH